MDNNRYKRYVPLGDYAIPKRTAYRYRNVIESPNNISFEEQNTPVINCIPNFLSNDEHDIREHCAPDIQIDDQQIRTAVEFENDLQEYLHQILLQDKIAKSTQSSSDPRSVDEMINSKDFFEPLSFEVDVSKGELLLMILKFSIVNNLSVTAMTDLFILINTIFKSKIMPDSKYMVDQLFDCMDQIEFHAVCHNCTAYIGNFNDIKNVNQCHICEIDLDLSNSTNTSFFVLINPSSQIKDLVTMHQNHYEYVVKERLHSPNCIRDVYDSKEYRKFVTSLPEQERENYITSVFNTDGANKFKCSRYSIWPLFIMLNELPCQERMSSLVTCGLWFNKQKPDMSIFLTPFVDMMNRLTKDGIPLTIKGEKRNLKLYINSCCVDSVARAPVQGMKQFNGKQACNWCHHPGMWVQDSMKYPLLETDVESRDHESTIHDMMIATPENPIRGLKYPSPLINLPSFNIISGFAPDYMHCCLEGVAKQLTEYHLSSMSDDDIIEIDSKINKITAPHQISRLSRPISLRNEWKAREWENYILYYSTVILGDYLKRDHYYHWLLFVESLYILLQDNIHVSELNQANKMLYEFVGKTEQYFGQKAMTYNIHQLLHLAESVLNWGPLWCHSTFSFESANHDLLKAIKCAKGVTSQIIRFIKINHTLSYLKERVYPYIDELIKIYCDDILESRNLSCSKISNITYFGKGSSIDNTLADNINLPQDALAYHKIVKDGCLYESNAIKKRRSNNSFIRLHDGRFAQINKFIADKDSKLELTVCNIINTRNSLINHYHMLQKILEIESNFTIIPTKDIKTVCISMSFSENIFLIPLPNLLHY